MATQIRRADDAGSRRPGVVELGMALPWHKPEPKPEVAEQPRQLDPLNEQDTNEWMAEQFAAGVEKVKAQIRDLQARGILDENGRRISKELPAEMLAGDKPSDVA